MKDRRRPLASPALRLVTPISIAESIHQAATLDNENGYRAWLRGRSVDDLMARFNQSVGSRAWVSARGVYLAALRDALLATGLDCSTFITDEGMSLRSRIERHGHALIPVREHRSQEGGG